MKKKIGWKNIVNIFYARKKNQSINITIKYNYINITDGIEWKKFTHIAVISHNKYPLGVHDIIIW